jgi:hypothetical protein
MANEQVKRYANASYKRLRLEEALRAEGKRYSALGASLSQPPIRVVFDGMKLPMKIAQSGENHDGLKSIENLQQTLIDYYNAQQEEERAAANLAPGEKAELDKMGWTGWKVAQLLDE